MTVTTRFAPSPTGRLHVGNVRTALHNWLFAKQQGGRFLLRMDDTDAARSTEENAQAIRDDLAWLGLAPDGEVRQSDRGARYEEVFAQLVASGRLYACYETQAELDLRRKVLLARGLPPIYERTALALTDAERAGFEAEARAPHWRFKLDHDRRVEWTDLIRGPSHLDPKAASDPVVRRADGSWLYMLPSVIDDVDMGITHVVRGEDHVTNSGLQIQMFEAMGAPPPAFAHEALITSVDGPLSKRLGAAGMNALREAGIEPIAVAALLARLGTSDPVEPVATPAPLIAGFDFARFGRAPARFDPAELEQLNARCIHLLDYDAVAGRLPADMGSAGWAAIRPNVHTVGEAAEWWSVVTGHIQPSINSPFDYQFLADAYYWLMGNEFGADVWRVWTGALKEITGRKGKELFLPLRLALTGREHGPDMAALLPLIGRERALERMKVAAGLR